MNLEEIRVVDVNWIQLAQVGVSGSCEYGNEPLSSIKMGNFLTG
jgi:hypothetical protein